MRKNNAFTLVEVLTGLVVIALLTAAMTMKSGSSRQSIRREAERLAAYINSLMQTADRNRMSFILFLNEGGCSVLFVYPSEGKDPLESKEYLKYFTLNPKYEIQLKNIYQLNYRPKNNNFSQGCTITIVEKTPDDIQDMSKYYVIIAAIGGRVRTSPNPPDNWEVNNNDYTY